jgi:hypothetical protein
MQRCVSQVETEGAPFLHALPANWAGLMRDLGAFTSARKMRSPAALLHALGSVLIVERAMLTPAVQKAYRFTNNPLTMSCLCVDCDKPIVCRTRPLMRARSVTGVRSLCWVPRGLTGGCAGSR